MRAARAPIATWPSWPQACITPRTREAYGASLCSVIGSPSMSTRSRTRGRGPPHVATRPVPPTPFCSSSVEPARNSTTRAAVSCSANASSGCWWISRRKRTSSERLATTSGDSGTPGFYAYNAAGAAAWLEVARGAHRRDRPGGGRRRPGLLVVPLAPGDQDQGGRPRARVGAPDARKRKLHAADEVPRPRRAARDVLERLPAVQQGAADPRAPAPRVHEEGLGRARDRRGPRGARRCRPRPPRRAHVLRPPRSERRGDPCGLRYDSPARGVSDRPPWH